MEWVYIGYGGGVKMEEFNKVKAKVLNELKNANMDDAKCSIIENKIAEYEQSYRSILKENITQTLHNDKGEKIVICCGNIEETKSHLLHTLKEEIAIIIDHDFDFDILNELSIFDLDDHDKLFLSKWLSANRAFFFDDENKINQNLNDLIAHIKEYQEKVNLKKLSLPKNDILKNMAGNYRNNITDRQKRQTPQDAINDTIKLFKTCAFNLCFHGEPFPPKTRKLLTMMSDFTKNPTGYIPIKPTIRAEIAVIRKFLNGLLCYDHEGKKQKLIKEDIKAFIDYFKIEDNYSRSKE